MGGSMSTPYVEVMRECFGCERFEACPKSILPDTMACEIFKLECVCNETRRTFREEVTKMLPSRKTLYIVTYILGMICGMILLLAFQGKLG